MEWAGLEPIIWRVSASIWQPYIEWRSEQPAAARLRPPLCDTPALFAHNTTHAPTSFPTVTGPGPRGASHISALHTGPDARRLGALQPGPAPASGPAPAVSHLAVPTPLTAACAPLPLPRGGHSQTLPLLAFPLNGYFITRATPAAGACEKKAVVEAPPPPPSRPAEPPVECAFTDNTVQYRASSQSAARSGEGEAVSAVYSIGRLRG